MWQSDGDCGGVTGLSRGRCWGRRGTAGMGWPGARYVIRPYGPAAHAACRALKITVTVGVLLALRAPNSALPGVGISSRRARGRFGHDWRPDQLSPPPGVPNSVRPPGQWSRPPEWLTSGTRGLIRVQAAHETVHVLRHHPTPCPAPSRHPQPPLRAPATPSLRRTRPPPSLRRTRPQPGTRRDHDLGSNLLAP
jgi:hypothetical protein